MICGIDLGTSTVKVTICRKIEPQFVVASRSEQCAAEILQSPSNCSEQSVWKILCCLKSVLNKIDQDIFQKIEYVAITGQMHGVLCWDAPNLSEISPVNNLCAASNLVTWQDQRLTPDFLVNHPQIHPGFGIGTLLFEKYGNRYSIFKGSIWGSIMDFVVYIALGLPQRYHVRTSSQIANSFGYFDPINGRFDVCSLKSMGFPIDTLPTIIPETSVIGETERDNYLNLPEGCKVIVPFGDTQTAFYSVIKQRKDCTVINLGTSCQVGRIAEAKSVEAKTGQDLQIFPYFKNSFLILNASMNGGNNLDVFVNGVFLPLLDSFCDISKIEKEKIVYEALVRSGLRALEKDKLCNSGNVQYTGEMFPERSKCNPLVGNGNQLGATISNLTSTSCDLGQLSLAFHRGIIKNAFAAFEDGWGSPCDLDQVVTVGNIFEKNKLFRAVTENLFSACSIFNSNSSLGAALFVGDNLDDLS